MLQQQNERNDRVMKKMVLCFILMFFGIEITQAETLKEACEKENLECNYVEKVNSTTLPTVYLFRGSGCKYCKELITYLSTLMADGYNEKVNIVSYEVKEDAENFKTYQRIASKFQDEANGYPYLVIGEYVFKGYQESDNKKIKLALNKLAEEENPYDVLEEVNAGNLTVVKKKEFVSWTGIFISITFAVILTILVLLILHLFKKKKPLQSR